MKLYENEWIDKKVFYVYGGVERGSMKEKKLEKSQKNLTMRLLWTSYGTFKNINIRNLHNIIFASPSKSRIRNLQSIGRGLRLKDNNSAVPLYMI